MHDSGQAFQLINQTTNEIIIEHLEVAESFWQRFKGLMGRRELARDHGLYLRPCNSIHCFFMRFPIDVVFLDKSDTVVAVYPAVRPWRIILPGSGAYSAIEGMAGHLAKQVRIGDSLTIKEANNEKISPQ